MLFLGPQAHIPQILAATWSFTLNYGIVSDSIASSKAQSGVMFPKIPNSGFLDLRQAKYAGGHAVTRKTPEENMAPPEALKSSVNNQFPRQMGSCSKQAVETSLVLLDGSRIWSPVHSVSTIFNERLRVRLNRSQAQTAHAVVVVKTVKETGLRLRATRGHYGNDTLKITFSPKKPCPLFKRLLTVADVQQGV